MHGSDPMRSRRKPVILIEGPEAAWRFEHALGGILSVSKDQLAAREQKYQQSRADKPRRGPKPKKNQ